MGSRVCEITNTQHAIVAESSAVTQWSVWGISQPLVIGVGQPTLLADAACGQRFDTESHFDDRRQDSQVTGITFCCVHAAHWHWQTDTI